MAVIEVDRVSKRFIRRTHRSRGGPFQEMRRALFPSSHAEPFWALRDISFSVKQGELLGIMGPNGAGKSTLLKIIAGTMPPTAGTVRVRGSIAPLLSLGAGFTNELTGRENVFINASLMGLSRRRIKRLLPDIIAFSEVGRFIDDPVKHYSSGMRARLGFAIAAHLDAAILLLDEVLSVGDANFRKKCLKRILEHQEAGKTFVLVTHGAGMVRKFCDRALVIDEGRLVQDGTVDEALAILGETDE